MTPTVSRAGALVLCSILVSCSSSSDAGKSPGASKSEVVVTGGPFSLAPGEEKYMCYTTTVDHDTAFHSFSIAEYPNVHHMFFARTLAPEPEAPFECPVLFKTTWLPVFTTGKGATTLDLPEGSAFDIPAGTQLVMQLHLVNTDSNPVANSSVEVHAVEMNPADQRYHAALYPFGTTAFELPPSQPSTVTHDCTVDKDMDAFVVFPHMHLLGTEIALQIGPDAANLSDVYRTAYDFNHQELVPVTFSLHVGDFARTTCKFQNTTSNYVYYGESTNQEMCFFAIFVKDGESLNGNCVDLSGMFNPRDAGP